MSCPELGPSAEYVDLHFNHSLWTEDGRNAMKDDDDAISQLALQWNAGLLQHAPALTAVCRPTINCQRRLPASVCSFPAQGLWAVETRTGVTRFKVSVPEVLFTVLKKWMSLNDNSNNRLFMAPHLVRAQSAYKDIRRRSFHHAHARTRGCTHARTHPCTHTHTRTRTRTHHAHSQTHYHTLSVSASFWVLYGE